MITKKYILIKIQTSHIGTVLYGLQKTFRYVIFSDDHSGYVMGLMSLSSFTEEKKEAQRGYVPLSSKKRLWLEFRFFDYYFCILSLAVLFKNKDNLCDKLLHIDYILKFKKKQLLAGKYASMCSEVECQDSAVVESLKY